MQNANRGDILGFSGIKRLPIETRRKPEGVLSEAAKELRKRFQEMKEKRTLLGYESVEPNPRFDAVFWSGYSNILQDEIMSTPNGPGRNSGFSNEIF